MKAKPMPPDHPEANRAGCNCPGTCNGSGAGIITTEDGYTIKEYTVNPNCPLHGDPKYWLPSHVQGV